MKITKIIVQQTDGGFKPENYFSLFPVNITLKSFWGRETNKMVYPTPFARIDKSGCPIFFHYCDELGVRLDNDISEQINRFLFIKNI
jgi:hypothetical protein